MTEHKKIVKVEHPGHEGKEVEIQGRNLQQKEGVKIIGGNNAGTDGTKIVTQRGDK